jgi:hypothetical protein
MCFERLALTSAFNHTVSQRFTKTLFTPAEASSTLIAWLTNRAKFEPVLPSAASSVAGQAGCFINN